MNPDFQQQYQWQYQNEKVKFKDDFEDLVDTRVQIDKNFRAIQKEYLEEFLKENSQNSIENQKNICSTDSLQKDESIYSFNSQFDKLEYENDYLSEQVHRLFKQQQEREKEFQQALLNGFIVQQQIYEQESQQSESESDHSDQQSESINYGGSSSNYSCSIVENEELYLKGNFNKIHRQEYIQGQDNDTLSQSVNNNNENICGHIFNGFNFGSNGLQQMCNDCGFFMEHYCYECDICSVRICNGCILHYKSDDGQIQKQLQSQQFF